MSRRVRPAGEGDLAALPAIELEADRAFEPLGLGVSAEARPAASLARYLPDRAWVACGEDGRPVGFALVDLVDGCAHVEQLSVRPSQQRRGHGRALLDAVAAWARSLNLPALTLSTFREVPWNAPAYERLGFRPLARRERLRQVALEGRPDQFDDARGGERGERLDLDDVAGHHEPDDL